MLLKFRIQSTPNPRARKYMVSDELKASGKVSYTNLEECSHVPMAQSLLSIPSVSQIHFFENVVTVTQNGSTDWQEIDHAVQNAINSKMKDHDIYFSDVNPSLKKPTKKLPPDLAEIDMILENSIRSGLQADGGDIEVIDYHDNILSVKYLGACGSCPSAMTGTLNAIRQILQEKFNKDLEVVVL